MLSNGHTLSSTFRCYHLILMTIKTFLMSLFYPNFSYHLMSDQIISPHFFPADPSSALCSPDTQYSDSDCADPSRYQARPSQAGVKLVLSWSRMRHWAVTTQITQSQARSPGPGLIKTLYRRRGCVTLYMCTVYSTDGTVRNISQDYETRIVSEKY